MLTLTLADLRLRARQFVIATIGVGLVLALALVLSGMANGFTEEIVQTVGAVGAQSWVLANSSEGRFTSFASFPESVARQVAGEPGVVRADPLLVVGAQVAEVGGAQVTYCLVGVARGGLGDPRVVSGHGLAGAGQVVADSRLHVADGQGVVLGGRHFTVVGTVSDRTLLGGLPVLYTSLADAQAIALNGRPLASAVVTVGVPAGVPPGFRVLRPAQVVAGGASQLASGRASINSTRWLMWVIAVFVVGAMLYVAALDRHRDFAVLKAIGSSSGTLFASLVLEAVVVTLVAAGLAELMASLLAPTFAQPVDIPGSARLTLPLIAVAVGVVSSLAAVRKATSADPAAAFA